MRGFSRFLFTACVLVALLPGLASAQITVPSPVESHKPIVATLAATLPPGAQLRGAWNVTGAEFIEVDASKIHIWAAPGVHTVVASGVWVVTKDVTIDGQTVPVLVDFGQYNYSAQFTVAADGPPVPPPVPGQRRGLIVTETAQQTPAQKQLFLELRKAYSDQLLPIIDRSHPPVAYSAAVSACGNQVPALVVLAADGVTIVRVVPLPATAEAVKQELSK